MFSDHLARQLRFVVPGACITLWLRTPSLIARIWTEAAPFARFVSVFGLLSVTLIVSLHYRLLVSVSALSSLLTIALFLYILLIPVIKGIPPDVRS
jgi:hypothetical protein